MTSNKKKNLGVQFISQGTVIDHILSHRTIAVVEYLNREYNITDPCFVGMNLETNYHGRKLKGIVKLSGIDLCDENIDTLAAISPGSTVSKIEAYQIVSKIVLKPPKEVRGIFNCNNTKCVTQYEDVESRLVAFSSISKPAPKDSPSLEDESDEWEYSHLTYACHYCEQATPLFNFKLSAKKS